MSGLLVTTRETFSFSNLSEQINTRDYANFDTLHVLGLTAPIRSMSPPRATISTSSTHATAAADHSQRGEK
jgi:hypothetical protein